MRMAFQFPTAMNIIFVIYPMRITGSLATVATGDFVTRGSHCSLRLSMNHHRVKVDAFFPFGFISLVVTQVDSTKSE